MTFCDKRVIYFLPQNHFYIRLYQSMKQFRVDYMSKKEIAKKFELECYICDKSYCI